MISMILAQAINFGNPCRVVKYPVRVQSGDGLITRQEVIKLYPELPVEICSWNKNQSGGIQFTTFSRRQQSEVYRRLVWLYGDSVSK